MSAVAKPVASPGVFAPPPGHTAEFFNPPQHSDGLFALIIVLLILSTSFLALRIFTKVHIIKCLGWEDLAITLAWTCDVVMMSLLLRELRLNAASHFWNLTIYEYPEYVKLNFLACLLYVPAIGLPKLAILLFFLRINPSRSFQIWTWIALALNFTYIIGFSAALIFPCHPVQKAWEPTTPGTCINTQPVVLAIPIAGTILDMTILILPIPMFAKLHTTRRSKLAILGIFSVSSMTTIISATRIGVLYQYLAAPDPTWDAAVLNCLSVVEVNMTVVCGSVLVLRPFCLHYCPWILGARQRSKPSNKIRAPRGPSTGSRYDGTTEHNSNSEVRTTITKASSKKNGDRGKWGVWGVEFGSTTFADEMDDWQGVEAELVGFSPMAASMGAIGVDGSGAINELRPVYDGKGDGRATIAEMGNFIDSDRSLTALPSWRDVDMENGVVKTGLLGVLSNATRKDEN